MGDVACLGYVKATRGHLRQLSVSLLSVLLLPLLLLLLLPLLLLRLGTHAVAWMSVLST